MATSRVRRVAYVMTHYPKHSQTFLIDEILSVQGDEVDIVPIALNPPEPGDVESEEERPRRHGRSTSRPCPEPGWHESSPAWCGATRWA